MAAARTTPPQQPVLARRPPAANRHRPAWAGAAVAAAVACGLYLPSIYNPMIWDDELHVPLSISGSRTSPFTKAGGEYRRPLVLLSYTLQDRVGLGSPAALHAANAAVHGANSAGAALLFSAFGFGPALALGAALLFAAHPIVSGSVAYISGRTDLLATFFTLAALLVAVGPRQAGGPAATTVARAVVVGVAVVAAALSKESGLLAGPLVAAVWWWKRRGPGQPRVGAAGEGSALVAAPLCSVLVAAFLLPPAATAAVPLLVRLRGTGTAVATYASLLLCPVDLHLDRLTRTGGDGAALLGLLFVVFATFAAVAFLRRPTTPRLAALALVMGILPGSGLLPVYPAIAERLVFTGEQFLYLPLLPLAALAAAGASRLIAESTSGRLPAFVSGTADRASSIPDATERAQARRADVVVLALCAAVAAAWIPPVLARQREFASAEGIYRKTLTHSPSPRACFNLGAAMLARQAHAEAAKVYEQCLAMAPGDAAAHGQLAIAWQGLGRSDDARREYERSLALDAGSARVWSNFATLDANAGLYAEARAKWEKALALDPAEATARDALARLSAAGR